MSTTTEDRPAPPPRPRGRPPLDPRVALASSVTVRLPTAVHDRLIRLAELRGVTVADLVRQRLLARPD